MIEGKYRKAGDIMMNYRETEQKLLLREMDKELLAMLVIDPETEEYEVIYTNGAYREFRNRYHQTGFFERWNSIGMSLMYEADRERMSREISRNNLKACQGKAELLITKCRFMMESDPNWCRIKVMRNPLDKKTVVLGIRNVDQELRQDMEYMAELESLLRREKIYREAILANAAGYMEVNLTRNQITSRIYDNRVKDRPEELSLPELGDPVPYDAFEQWWADHMILSDKEEFLAFSNCSHLLACYERGERIVSAECRARTLNDEVSICVETYYMSEDTVSGDVKAICVLYDLTQRQRQEKDLRELQETLKKMRMKNFISQMHPHFLYNALSSIREIVLTDPEYGADMLYDFTTHLRASIRAMSNDNKIWFSQELENIKAYVNIEKMRFGNRLQVVYNIGSNDFQIIPLSIQPIVENAIKHGLYEKESDGGTVTVSTAETEENWIVVVADDGIGFDAEQIQCEVAEGRRDSTGLHNLIFRLENMMKARVLIRSRIGNGTTVTVEIPKKERNC